MSPETNKVLGAVLGTLTFTLFLGFASDLIFNQEAPEKPGYEVAEAAAEGAAAEGGEEVAAVEPIAVRLASADPTAGEGLTKACSACHVLDSTNANKVGPGLWNIVNRKPGAHEGFSYSNPMVAFGETNLWDYEHLDSFLANPKGLVAGTKMAYAGMKKPEDRANLIAYLRTLADSPAPLPEAGAAPAEAPATEAAPAPAEGAAPAPQP